MTKAKLKRIILTALMGAFAVLFSGCSSEESYRLVKVNSFEGEVSVRREEKLDAFEGLQLVSEDNVAVGEASFLELLADSDKHIAAEENTGFTLHSTGNSESGSITIELLYGKALFSIDNKLNDSSSFDVNTPNATLSVRGTSFSVAYDLEEKKTEVEVFEGKVRLASHGKVSYLEKGDSATIKSDDENGVVVSEGVSDNNEGNGGNKGEETSPKVTENLFGIAMSYSGGSDTASKAEYVTELSDYTVNKAGIKENDAAIKKFTSIIKKHSADVDKFINDSKNEAVKNNKQTDITEWFTDKVTSGDKTIRIDKAVMSLIVDANSAVYGVSDAQKTVINGREVYYDAGGVFFEFYGDFEAKTEAVTTSVTTESTEATTVPVSEDSSDTTTEPAEDEQEETVSTPSVTTAPVTAAPTTTKATTTTKKETTTGSAEKSNSIKMQEVVSGRIVYVNIPSGYKLWEYDAADYKSEGKLYGALLVPTKKGKYNISVTFENDDPMKTLVKKGKADYDGFSYKVVDSYKCTVNSSKTGTVYIAERVGSSGEYLVFVECVSGETEYLVIGMEDEDGNTYNVMTKYLYGTTTDIKKFARQMFPAK